MDFCRAEKDIVVRITRYAAELIRRTQLRIVHAAAIRDPFLQAADHEIAGNALRAQRGAGLAAAVAVVANQHAALVLEVDAGGEEIGPAHRREMPELAELSLAGFADVDEVDIRRLALIRLLQQRRQFLRADAVGIGDLLAVGFLPQRRVEDGLAWIVRRPHQRRLEAGQLGVGAGKVLIKVAAERQRQNPERDPQRDSPPRACPGRDSASESRTRAGHGKAADRGRRQHGNLRQTR